ncbi:MAG: DUF1573 domain-containing protein [Bacteroidales bacterium]|nr:DUF1573 domain-containing protein [Bacteroidales bacterium]
MNKINLLFSFIFIFTSSIFAQTVEPNMTFETEKHDFGKIKESGGNVEFQFTFTNLGSKPIVINDVKSTCGCTTPSWSKKPIAPGEKGYIKTVFNPYNRPGVFHKSVTVNSNAKNSPVTLHISGEVIPKSQDIADEYRYQIGPVKLKKNNVHFSEIYNTETKKDKIEIINVSKETVKIGFNEKRRMPAHLTVICKPETLAPNQKGVIFFTYDASKKNDWGYVYDRIYLNFNGNNDSKNRMNVSAIIKEKFSQDMIDNPPVFTPIGNKTYDFGKIKQGETVEHIFTFKNTGKNDLIIRKTKASCGCTAVQLGDKVVKPGEESSIKAIFNSRGKRGNQHKSITVTTNIPDVEGQPKRSQIILMVKGIIEVPETGNNNTVKKGVKNK